MKKNLRKALILSALCAALAAGCATVEPPPTPQAIAAAHAAFEKIDWGVLTPYINQQYRSDDGLNFLSIHPDPMKGVLRVHTRRDGSHEDAGYYRDSFEIRPTETPNTYHFGKIDGRAGLIRIGEDGRAHALDKPLAGLRLEISADKAEIEFKNFQLSSMKRDIYRMPDGVAVPVSYTPDSAYQKIRAGKPFGIWEEHVGRTYVGEGQLLTISKDDNGNLVLTYTNLENKNPSRVVISPPPKMRLLSVPEVKNPRTHRLYLDNTDTLVLWYDDDDIWRLDKGSFGFNYTPRGDRIVRRGHKEWRGYYRSYINTAYEPVTQERLVAAIEYNERAARNREQNRQAAAERAASRRAMENAIISGLASGLAQAQQSSDRLNQMSRDFERRTNAQLRQIEQDNKKREAARLMSQLETNRKTVPNASLAAGKATQVAQAGATAQQSQRQQAAQRQAQAKAEAQARADEQARQREEAAREKAQEDAKRQREEAARQEKLRAEQALKNHLAAERRGIRLRAETCPGQGGFPSAIGTRPAISPRVAQCIFVHFEARCPGEPAGSGMRGTIERFQGSGSCFDNSYAMPRKLSCDVQHAIVAVTDVTTCP